MFHPRGLRWGKSAGMDLLLWTTMTGWQREVSFLGKETEHGWQRGHRDRRAGPSRGKTSKFTLRS